MILHMQATITFKWKAWARRLLFVELGFYLMWLLAFQGFVLLFQASPACHDDLPWGSNASSHSSRIGPNGMHSVMLWSWLWYEPC